MHDYIASDSVVFAAAIVGVSLFLSARKIAKSIERFGVRLIATAVGIAVELKK